MCELSSSHGMRVNGSPRRKMVSGPSSKSLLFAAQHPYRMVVARSFLVKIIFFSVGLSFMLGNISQRWMMNQLQGSTAVAASLGMPVPMLPKGKEQPRNAYTSNHNQTNGLDVISSDTLLSREVDQCEFVGEPLANAQNEESLHQPTGQHLIVDIENVDAEFLNDAQRLAQAMVDLINLSGLTMLSYHCHDLKPMGVTCVGVLLESHVSFHTWPIPGVITLDLFTCGDSPLMPLLNIIENLFGVPQRPAIDASGKKPNMEWCHKYRGFQDDDDDDEDASGRTVEDDLGFRVLSHLRVKKEKIAEVETGFQSIAIYDVHDRFHTPEALQESQDPSTYWGKHPDMARPDRRIYLDSVLQSKRYGDAAYHEALVHPAMYTHPNPKRVAILGGGEGATLREVLKHDTVEEVAMIEIDAEMIEVCKRYLPEWSDCSMIDGSTTSCYDDLRTSLYPEDAINWFVQRYGDASSTEPKFDVIIMDVLDPDSSVPFSDIIYRNDVFSSALMNGLGDDGVFVLQQGEANSPRDSASQMSESSRVEYFTAGLLRNGIESQHEYDEGHGGFEYPWSFLLSLKDESLRARVMTSNQAEIDLELRRRIRRSTSDEPLLRYFDGASMMQYQFPDRITQDVYCRAKPTPESCLGQGLDPSIQNIPRSQFEVKASTVNTAGRGVFAMVDIPAGSYISMEHSVHSMFLSPSTLRTLNTTADEFYEFPYLRVLNEAYVDGYGWIYPYFGEPAAGVDPGIFTFVNHGCNGTYNAGEYTEKDEGSMSAQELRAIQDDDREAFDPVGDRAYPAAGVYQSLRDIKAGEELLDNYLMFYEHGEIEELRTICAGGIGLVSQYESGH